MRHDEYDAHDALGLAELVRSGEVSASELLDTALARIDAVDGTIGAMASVDAEHARALIDAGLPDGPFTGVPFVLKDLGCEAVGLPSSAGSRWFVGSDPGYDCELYARLRRSGLVTFGRTTSPELGIGPTTEAIDANEVIWSFFRDHPLP